MIHKDYEDCQAVNLAIQAMQDVQNGRVLARYQIGALIHFAEYAREHRLLLEDTDPQAKQESDTLRNFLNSYSRIGEGG